MANLPAMTHHPTTWKAELAPTLALAAPVVLAELGWVSMGVIDLLMVGHLGPAAIGAVGIGNIVFFSIVVFGMGLLLGLDTLVSQAYGGRRLGECHRWLVQGVYLAVALTPLLMLLILGTMPLLASIGLAKPVMKEVGPYLHALTWSTLPLLIHVAFRRYLQAMSLARPVMVALLVANGLKVLGNAALVHGAFGGSPPGSLRSRLVQPAGPIRHGGHPGRIRRLALHPSQYRLAPGGA